MFAQLSRKVELHPVPEEAPASAPEAQQPLLAENERSDEDRADVEAAAGEEEEQGTSSALPAAAPLPARKPFLFGISRDSIGLVLRLCSLFALDSFGGGLVNGTLMAYFFAERFNASTAYAGSVLAGANIIAGLSTLVSGWLAQKLGMVVTMVATHAPSNILLILVPFMRVSRAMCVGSARAKPRAASFSPLQA